MNPPSCFNEIFKELPNILVVFEFLRTSDFYYSNSDSISAVSIKMIGKLQIPNYEYHLYFKKELFF